MSHTDGPDSGWTDLLGPGECLCRAWPAANRFFCLAAYWRFWLCVSVVYELFLIFILFQVGGTRAVGR